MMPAKTEAQNEPEPLPVDLGDAGGVGNGAARKIVPGTLRKPIDPEEVPARETEVRLARLLPFG